MARNKSISITDEQMERLGKLAALHGYYWSDKPSVSRLIAAVADGELPLHPQPRPDAKVKSVLKSLQKCIDILEG
jgi:hypothetical protein